MSTGCDHSIQRVKDAKKELDKAEARVWELNGIVRNAQQALENPSRSGVSDPSGVMGQERTTQAVHIIEAHTWPKIEDIDAAIRTYRKCQTAIRGAFEALSDEDKLLAKPLLD